MKGRPPKPTETKKKAGNPGKRELPDNVVTAGRGQPPKPATLGAQASAVWDEVVPLMEQAGTLDKADGAALEVFCTALAISRQAADMLPRGNGTGLVIQQPSGRYAADPHFNVWKDAATVVRQFAEQFGLTPSARARLGVLGAGARPEDLDTDIGPSPRLRKIDGGRAT